MKKISETTTRFRKLFNRQRMEPYYHGLLNFTSYLAHLSSTFLIVTSILEFGFHLSDYQMGHVNWLYFWVWITFLLDRGLHLVIRRKIYWDSHFSFIGWAINSLLLITLIPIGVKFLGYNDTDGIIGILSNRYFHIVVLFLISIMDISDETIRFLGRKTNPAIVLSTSFLFVIFLGSVVLTMPRCLQPNVHITWVDAFFTSTSAVCVTGLTSVNVATTFTTIGQLAILLLIQIGGLGVMTITSFFALFFMGNTTIYNQMVVRDMVSSDSLASLVSTLLNIFGFTAVIELVGALFLYADIHGTLGLESSDELFFCIFHSISAFCNAGFSNFDAGLCNPQLLDGHNSFYLCISLLVILGGIGYPVLVNLKSVLYKHFWVAWQWMRGKRYVSFSLPKVFDLNTQLVLYTTCSLFIVGFLYFAIAEWNGVLEDMPFFDKLTHAFFLSVCPRTAGFSSVNLNDLHIQSIMIYMILMWIGGSSLSTAGGIKVNTFGVAFLNMRTIMQGSVCVEFARRELSIGSIRRANATIFVSLLVLFIAIFSMSIIEPHLPLKSIIFECISALSTVGVSLDLTTELSVGGKILVAVLMFIGRVSLFTLVQSILHQKKENPKYKLPIDHIIIS